MKLTHAAILAVSLGTPLVLLVATETPPAKEPPAPAALRQAALGDLPRFIFLAVLDGLYTDGVSNDVVDAILTRDSVSGRPQHFVYACPICMPAHDALQTYRARPAFYGRKIRVDTFGPGLPAELVGRITGKDLQVRLDAINGLVESWVRRRLEAMRLDPAERDAWTWAIAQGREKGMQMLESFRAGARQDGHDLLKSCAFCDGAAGACKRQ